MQKIHENAAALPGFVEHQHVDQRRLQVFDPLRIERPLIALQKYIAGHLPHGGKHFGQKLALVRAVGIGAVDARDDLHVCARNVPAEFDAGQAELRFGEVFGRQARLERQAVDAQLSLGIDGRFVKFARPAGGQHEVFADENIHGIIGRTDSAAIDGDHGRDAFDLAFADGDQPSDLLIVDEWRCRSDPLGAAGIRS